MLEQQEANAQNQDYQNDMQEDWSAETSGQPGAAQPTPAASGAPAAGFDDWSAAPAEDWSAAVPQENWGGEQW